MYCVAHSKNEKPASQLRYYIAYHPADYCAIIILSVIILRNAGRLLRPQLLLRWPTTVQISRYVGTTTGSHYAIIRQIEY
jgi:hypothetical protein